MDLPVSTLVHRQIGVRGKQWLTIIILTTNITVRLLEGLLVLLVLFIISVLGPEMAAWMDMVHAPVTVLITALVSTLLGLLCNRLLQHLKFELKYVQYMLATTVVFSCSSSAPLHPTCA